MDESTRSLTHASATDRANAALSTSISIRVSADLATKLSLRCTSSKRPEVRRSSSIDRRNQTTASPAPGAARPVPSSALLLSFARSRTHSLTSRPPYVRIMADDRRSSDDTDDRLDWREAAPLHARPTMRAVTGHGVIVRPTATTGTHARTTVTTTAMYVPVMMTALTPPT
eukprot:GHVU01110180.1.p1 GENE.GHVU01110180.1~~GHVU01110180.1.p1  ORF type:complete len:171 (-),score=1.15 GHVU01110180.1:300-812(-)